MASAKNRPPLVPGATDTYPVLPLRDIVVFPHMIVPLFVGPREIDPRARRGGQDRRLYSSRDPAECVR